MRPLGGGKAPALLAGASSVLLSLVVIAPRQLVNSDGVWYLLAAEAYLAGGLPAAQAAHPWPIYAVLIGAVAGATGITARAAADVLNTVFLALASAAFVETVRMLGGERRLQWYAAAVVVAHRGMNLFRGAIIRDFGGWALALIGLAALLRFLRSGSLGAAATWLAAGIVAVAFRPEWAVIWAATALAPLFDTSAPGLFRLRRFAVLAGPAAAISLALGLGLFASPTGAASVWAMTADVTDLGADAFRESARVLAESFPYPHGREYAPYVLLFGLAPLPLVKFVLAAGLPVAALALIGLGALRDQPRANQAAIGLSLLGWYVVCYLFALERMFVETRYAVPASLVLALTAPFGMARLSASRPTAATRAVMALGAVWLVLTAWLALGQRRNPDQHVGAAIEWLRTSTPPTAQIHTNSPQIAYYCGRTVDWAAVRHAISNGPARPLGGPYHYWAILVPANAARAPDEIGTIPGLRRVASFRGPSGGGVEVYRAAP